MAKIYNTSHHTHVIKTHLNDEELADFNEKLDVYGMNQSEYIRQAITGATIRPVIKVSPINEKLLTEIGTLTGQFGKIGSNLNQIARYLNQGGQFTPQMENEIVDVLASLLSLKFEVLKKVGDAVGNDQAYQL